MPKLREFDKTVNSFMDELYSIKGIPKIKIKFKSSTTFEYPRGIEHEEISFILLARVAHFLAIEVAPDKFDDIKTLTMRILGTDYISKGNWDKTKGVKYFTELFGSKVWNERDLTKNTSANSGKNHLVLLGEANENNWYSLKLNRYHAISSYSLMIGYKDHEMNVYKFGLKH